MKQRSMFWALVIALLVVGALPAVANIINEANVTATCTGYTITVGGYDLAKPDTVTYTITLTPASGTPITITDSIAVVPIPHDHGIYSGTNTQTWAHYGATLGSSSYTLTGKATLVELKSPKYDTIKIKFSPDTLSCAVASVTCLPSSSLGVLVQSTNVVTYVPNGAWASSPTGLQVVQIEPTTPAPTSISTPNTVNSCSSNSVTGETVCSSNVTDVYLITGTTLNSTLSSGATTYAGFSGGECETCGVAMNETANKAVLTIGDSSSSSLSGIQLLDLASNTLSAPVPAAYQVSEDVVWDQSRNLILSPDEGGVYDLFNTSTGGEFGNSIGGTLDSAAEDCKTGIALATDEFTSELYITDLTQATFTAGTPGSWTAPGQFQNFPDFEAFAAGTDGIAVAPGVELAIVTGEFAGNTFGALQLPSTSGTGTPGVVDFAAAALPPTPDGNTFAQGLDPHTVTAYVSPNSGKAYGLIANGYFVPPTYLAVIDLQGLLSAPRLAGVDAAGNPCATCANSVDPSYDLVAHGVVTYVATQ